MDSFSKFLDATWNGLTANALVAYLRIVFRHFGPPETVVSDNGSQFSSSEFASLCAEFRVTHLRCATRMPMSDGQAERMVHSIKKSLEASSNSLDVAAYNYTPNAAIENDTPAHLFSGRDIRTFDVFRPLDVSSELTH